MRRLLSNLSWDNFVLAVPYVAVTSVVASVGSRLPANLTSAPVMAGFGALSTIIGFVVTWLVIRKYWVDGKHDMDVIGMTIFISGFFLLVLTVATGGLPWSTTASGHYKFDLYRCGLLCVGFYAGVFVKVMFARASLSKLVVAEPDVAAEL